MKKILLIICCLLLVSCSEVEKNNITLNKESIFLGTITDEFNEMTLLLNTEVYLTTVNSIHKDKLINTAKTEITKYHKLLDSHHYYLDSNKQRINNIKVLNDNIGKGPIKVDPFIIDVLSEAIEISILTNGYFNFTLGLVSKLYDGKFLPFESINTDPIPQDIETYIKGIIPANELKNYIIINNKDNTIELKSKDIPYELDLGAFSKGYIIDKVYEKLISFNTSFLLTAGSSSIIAYKSDKEDINWNVGVVNPKKIDDYLVAFNLNNGAISSSGDYENFYLLENDTRRHHILNPYTGYSENFYHSNTLLSSKAGIIDALSTALFNIKDKDERNIIIKNIEDFYKIDIDYCIVNDDYGIIMNQDFKNILIDDRSLDKIIIEN